MFLAILTCVVQTNSNAQMLSVSGKKIVNGNQEVIFSSSEERSLRLSIFTIKGDNVLNTSMEGNNKTIDVNNISTGVYFLRAIGQDVNKTIKIIKK